jgi:large subunit ribosomal protein L20
MSRVKGGVAANKRRRNILSNVKGYRFARSKKKRSAIDAIHHAGSYAFAHRKDKKNDFRQLWIARMNAALRENGTTYSKFVGAMKKKGVALDRKVLAIFAHERPIAFARIIASVK